MNHPTDDISMTVLLRELISRDLVAIQVASGLLIHGEQLILAQHGRDFILQKHVGRELVPINGAVAVRVNLIENEIGSKEINKQN